MAEAAEKTENGEEAKKRHPPVLLHGSFLIDPNAPLSGLNTPSAMAYEVEDRDHPDQKLFALICKPDLLPRTEILYVLRGKTWRGLLPLVDWEIADWPPLGQRTLLILYRRPLGGRVIDAVASGDVKVSEHDVQNHFIEPLTDAIKEMDSRNISHRAIRPDNLFYMDAERQDVVLGDCVTVPPGFDQPLACEPLERSMASPAGRGNGDITDDLYSLGATLVQILTGDNPASRLDANNLIMSRIEMGSYATLSANTRIPMSLIEPLRGLLSDDIEERWGLRELNLWGEGQRQTPLQRKATVKGETAISFAGRDHLSARTLAHAFTLNVGEAAKMIKEGLLELWLRHSLHDAEIADIVHAAVEAAKVHAKDLQGSDDYIVTKISIILDPAAPIRFKAFSFMPDAFGTALAAEYLHQGNVQAAFEIVLHDIPKIWLNIMGTSPTTIALDRTFGQLRRFLQNNDTGFGIERCLYELNPGLPCQSKFLAGDYVTDIDNLLSALDQAVKRVDTKSKPLDRHISAFIVAHFDEDITPHLKALASKDEETALIGMLSLLAFLQWSLKTEPLYGLSSWVGGLLGPAINTYNSRTTRREIEREIPRLVRQGSLPDLFDLIDNSEKRKQDADGFEAAKKEFAEAENEIHEIAGSDASTSESALKTGQQAAAMSSVVITMVVVSILFLFEAW